MVAVIDDVPLKQRTMLFTQIVAEVDPAKTALLVEHEPVAERDQREVQAARRRADAVHGDGRGPAGGRHGGLHASGLRVLIEAPLCDAAEPALTHLPLLSLLYHHPSRRYSAAAVTCPVKRECRRGLRIRSDGAELATLISPSRALRFLRFASSMLYLFSVLCAARRKRVLCERSRNLLSHPAVVSHPRWPTLNSSHLPGLARRHLHRTRIHLNH
jgi:hypothetical protein